MMSDMTDVSMMPSGSTEMNTLTKEKVVDEKNQRRLLLRW
jgi:hypothetical protein